MDIMTVTRPHLTVTDALICGEGDGPIANLPRWGNLSGKPQKPGKVMTAETARRETN